jgi:hypothetical protein
MVYIWFIYGLYMVYIWFIYGFHNLPAKWYNLRLFLPFGTEKDVGKLSKSSDKSVSTIFSHGHKWKMLGVFWTNPLIWWIHIKESTKYGYIYIYNHILVKPCLIMLNHHFSDFCPCELPIFDGENKTLGWIAGSRWGVCRLQPRFGIWPLQTPRWIWQQNLGSVATKLGYIDDLIKKG